MKKIMTAKQATEQYNILLDIVVRSIQNEVENNYIDFDDNGWEDLGGNEVCGVDNEKVYFNTADGDDTYPLHELGLIDGIKMLEEIEIAKAIQFKFAM